MIVLYLLILLSLGIYSYSQIDLNLTLLQTPWFLSFQRLMVQLGYFNRPLSTGIFVGLTLLLVVIYWMLVKHAERLSKRDIVILLLGLSVLAIFSYPAFSHDIFNYIYSGRIVLVHHVNPYQVTPLMFPSDDWTRFMQWTHVPFAWGPVYLLLLTPFYLLGLGKFTLTLLSFKLMTLLAYLGSCWIINKFSGKKGLVLFALNPLVIYEALVSAHVDMVMLFFALLAIHFWSRRIFSWASLIVSIGIKYATATLIPALFLFKDAQKAAFWLIALSYLGAVIQVLNREVLPHYLIVPFGITALFPQKKKWVFLSFFLTVILLLVRYLPFLYTGQWLTLKIVMAADPFPKL